MDKLQNSEYEMLRKVHMFGGTYPKFFPAGTYAYELMDQLGNILDDLGRNWSLQKSHKSSAEKETARKSKAKDDLRFSLKLIVDTSCLMERTTPGVSDRFKPPRGTSDAALLHTARIFLENIVPLRDVFAKYAGGADVIEELNVGIAGLERHLREREEWRGRKKTVTADIDGALRKGKEIIAQLDVIVHRATRDDKFFRKEWKVARHVRQVYRKKKKAAPAKAKAAGA